MKKFFCGFTLVELIVTVSIIMILTGVGAMSLNSFNGVKELESVRDEVGNHLKLARNYAITKQLPVGKGTGLDYVRVSFSGNNITIAGVDGTTVYPESPYSTKILPVGISVSSTSDFGFAKSTGQLKTSTGGDTTMTVVVTLSRGTNTKSININNFGQITNVN